MHDAILKQVNLKKADLRNAELERANLEKANVDNAKVNDGTDMNHVKAEGISGMLEHEAENGTITPMKPEAKIEQDNQAHASKNRSAIGKFTAKTAGVIGNATKKVGEFIKQPLSTKWGRIIGVVVGGAVAAAIITTTVLTAGLSIPVMAAVAGGTILACGGVGAVAGHFAAKHVGLSTLAGAGAGFVVGGPIGAAVGAVGMGAVNSVSKQAFGNSIDGIAGNTLVNVGEKGQEHAKNVEEQRKCEEAQKRSNELYNPPILKTSKDTKIDRTQEAIIRGTVVQSKSKDTEILKGESVVSVQQKKGASKETAHGNNEI